MNNCYLPKLLKLTALLLISTLSTTTYAATVDAVADGSFESGLTNTDWTLSSTSAALTDFPLCGPDNSCPAAGFAHTGDWHVWIGGVFGSETSSVEQTVTIPTVATNLTLWAQRNRCDDPSDTLHISLDGTDIGTLACTAVDGASVQYTFSVLGYNDGGTHLLNIGGTVGGTSGNAIDHTNIFLDDVSIPFAAYTVGGSVSGLAAGNDVTLQNNTGDDLVVNANGNFTFSTLIADLSAYAVTVSTQPTTPNQTCVVNNAGGNLAGANITTVDVACTTNTYPVEGTINGLVPGANIVLQNNAGDDLNINANGSFTFATELDDESNYDVTILSSSHYSCSILNGSGTLAGSGTNNITISCTYTATIPTLQEWALVLLAFLLLVVSLKLSRKCQAF